MCNTPIQFSGWHETGYGKKRVRNLESVLNGINEILHLLNVAEDSLHHEIIAALPGPVIEDPGLTQIRVKSVNW